MSRRIVGAPLLLLLACVGCSTAGDPSGAPAGHSGATAAASGDSGGGNGGGSSGSSSGGAGTGGAAAQATGGSSGSGMSGSSGTSGSTGVNAGGGGSGTEAGSSGSGGSGAGAGGSDGGAGGQIGGAAGEGTAGTGGSGFPFAGDHCNFAVEHAQSSAIGTVTIVTWSTDLEGLSEAHIDFGLPDSDESMSAPVELARDGHRTLLLGMKPARSYRFRIVATSASETCTSPAFDVTTGPLPDNVPPVTKSESSSGGVRGFFLATPGVGAGGVPGRASAFIFDTDGDVVWWGPGTPNSSTMMSSARMSWDGQSMWIVNANGGALYKTSMDGLVSEAFAGAATANHDVAPLPEGGVATFGYVDNGDALIEVHDDGTVATIVMLEDVYQLEGRDYHPNALAYHPADDTFTISDLTLNGFVKIRRDGELLWQLGGTSPLGQSFELVGLEPWSGNHGHDLGPDGQFLFFNNFPITSSGTTIFELKLDEQAWTATMVWDYELTSRSQYLGGTQRLPNSNTSVVHSQGDRVYEVNTAGEIVQTFSHSAYNAGRESLSWAVFGYANFRPTLYGPPPSTWPE